MRVTVDRAGLVVADDTGTVVLGPVDAGIFTTDGDDVLRAHGMRRTGGWYSRYLGDRDGAPSYTTQPDWTETTCEWIEAPS